MKLSTTFRGEDLLFEGDLPLLLRAIPAGAKITRAQATLEPALAGGATAAQQFHETLAVSHGQGDFGVSVQAVPGSTIIDLGARRTVERIIADGMNTQVRVQVDLGGIWMPINNSGLPVSPSVAAPNMDFDVVNNAVALPGLATQRLKVQPPGVTPPNPLPAPLDVRSVQLLSYPSNLVLRLGTFAPVWFKVGDLRAPLTTPDFAPILQAFLDRSQPAGGIFETPFILHSDALTRLRLTLDIDYYVQQSLLAPQLSQVVLPFGYGALPSAQPAAITAALPLNARVLPRATSARVFGRFDASRVIYGPISATVVGDTIRVAPQQSVANAVLLSRSQAASAIDLHVESVTPAAKLLVTLQEDVGGKPWGSSLLPEPIEVTLERPAAGGPTWASAPLPADFTFHADQIYWLIVNIAEGEVNWAIEAAGQRPPLQVTRDNGLSWRTYAADLLGGPAVGLYRLRATLAQYRQPLQLDVAGHRVSLSAYDALGKLDFNIDLPTLADALNAALDDAAAQQQNTFERVANGAFAAWTRIDRRGGRLGSQPVPTPDLRGLSLVVAPDAARVYYLGAGTPIIDDGEETGMFDPTVGVLVNDAQPRLLAPIQLTGEELSTIQPQAMTMAPDGRQLYVAVADTNSDSRQLFVWKVDPLRNEAQESIALSGSTFDRPVRLAADPRCRFVYMTVMHSLIVNSPTNDVPALIRMDAQSLAVRGEDQDLPRPGNQLAAGGPPQPLDKLALTADLSFNQGSAGPPLELLIAPDGRRAYVAMADGIQVVDLDSWTWLGQVWGGDSRQELQGVALSCDGTRLYALITTPEYDSQDTQHALLVLDTALLDQAAVKDPKQAAALSFERTILRRIALPLGSALANAAVRQLQLNWIGMAVTPDDTRLLIADFRASRLQVLDTATYTLLDPIAVPAGPLALCVTPESRRAFVPTATPLKRNPPGDNFSTAPSGGIGGFQFNFHAVELDAWTADQWAVTGGRAAPVCVPGAAKRSARLGSPSESSGLSQVFSVVGGQEYVLRFQAMASAPGAQAELFWLSRGCGLLGQITIDITPARCGEGMRPYTALQSYTTRCAAPQAADRAELRFKQPFDGYALLDDVSFVAPAEATMNGDFAVKVAALDPVSRKPVLDPSGARPVQVPQGWTIAPADVPVDLIMCPNGDCVDQQPGVRLTPPTAAPVTLSQALTIAPGQPFLLEFQAFPSGPQSSHDAPTIELRWSGSTTPPLITPLDRQQFDIAAIGGVAPADASGVELAFVQPPGGTLAITQVRLSQPNVVQVPITFLSEAPGELTVSAAVVAYDVSAAPRPTPPGTPPARPVGCKPTPPDDVPPPPGGTPKPGEGSFDGEPEPLHGFCPCCETVHMLDEPEVLSSEGGMTAVSGHCPNCDVDVVMFVTRS